MGSRIFWFLLAGAALLGGMAWQDGGQIFHWDDDSSVAHETERTIEGQVERAVERGLDGMKVVGADGREIEASTEIKRALSNAIGRLVEAQTDLAMLRIGDGSDREIEEATARRDKARADIERIKADIKGAEQAAKLEQEAVREQIQRDVREQVRETVREAVRN